MSENNATWTVDGQTIPFELIGRRWVLGSWSLVGRMRDEGGIVLVQSTFFPRKQCVMFDGSPIELDTLDLLTVHGDKEELPGQVRTARKNDGARTHATGWFLDSAHDHGYRFTLCGRVHAGPFGGVMDASWFADSINSCRVCVKRLPNEINEGVERMTPQHVR